jgi:osmoprotectant transport system ATP-binding protein
MPDAISLEAREVSKRYGPVTALDSVSLAVHRAECVALIGESGSGKTTLLRCFNRLTDPDAGVVLVDGVDTGALDPVALRRRIGYVPQDGGLMPHWRVRRNVALVPWLRGQDDAAAQADRALQLVGLEPSAVAERWPRELSGGQRQRVAVARALAARPDLVLLDEPFGALDAITRADLQASFRDLRRELVITTLLVTHDLSEAFLLADRVAVMHAGRIEQVATPDELRAAPATPYVRTLLARARVPA